MRYSSIRPDELEELDAFCEEFLCCTCCEDHEVATKLAKLSIFLCTRQEELKGLFGLFGVFDDRTRDPSVLSILSEKTDEEEHQIRRDLEKEGRLIIPATPIDFKFLRPEFHKYLWYRGFFAGVRYELDRWAREEGTIMPLTHHLERTGSVSWWRDDPSADGLEFRVCSEERSIAEFRSIKPADVIAYLGSILEENKA